jgi:ribosomal protein S18 acetylase RimI-like enzyme
VNFQAIADNLRESFRVVAASRNAGEVRELPGVSIASANVTFQMFNAAFLSTPVETAAELTQRVLIANMHFNTRGREWAWWMCEDWLEPRLRRRARQVLERQGLRHSTDLPGMCADHILPPRKQLPAPEIRRVGDEATRNAFCEIGSVCFHVPISWFREVFDNSAVWSNFASYVGYLDGVPVSTAAIVRGAGVLGVYNVATLPGYQRHGYGEVVMRYAMADVQREAGEMPFILQSTPAGLNLYERMGFRTITQVSVYAS